MDFNWKVIMNNDVVIYQSADGLVKIEAMIDSSNETIWATQKAIRYLLVWIEV